MSALNEASPVSVQDGHDLASLAWVLEELRRTLESASVGLRRFVRAMPMGADPAAVPTDVGQLHQVRQQLHQAAGALEMVGRPEPAKVLRAMEALAEQFVQNPQNCTDEAVDPFEQAGAALMDYLVALLRGKTASPVALFPQYQALLQQIGEGRIHPADLWTHAWHWIDLPVPQTPALTCSQAVRARMDPAVLQWVKTGQAASARVLSQLTLGLAHGAQDLEPRVFWKLCSAYFEALALGLCPPDVHAKRTTARILQQYAALARGESQVAQRLAQDLLFFCAQAVPPTPEQTPVLAAVREAYGLTQAQPVEYAQPVYGRFKPALLAQARKRMASASEAWSALVGGDTNRLPGLSEPFAGVTDTLPALLPESAPLAEVLRQVAQRTVQTAEVPATALAMEVATALLYLDATLENIDPLDPRRTAQCQALAERVGRALQGYPSEPLADWMEEVYRRAGERQTLGGVVAELRAALAEVEGALDQFFRQPQDPNALQFVPDRLHQMRGVFSVLGLEQAALAIVHLRGCTERFLAGGSDPHTHATLAERLGNSLGALGFLVDMLSYQRALARSLFVFDEERGEFRPVMGRAPAQPQTASFEVVDVIAPDEGQALPTSMLNEQAPHDRATLLTELTAESPVDESVDDALELRGIFLGEAREALAQGRHAWQDLGQDPADPAQQTVVRRMFHTLKGSARMVGLSELGEAAWAMEQLFNAWLASPRPVSAEVLALTDEALQQITAWVQAIEQEADANWRAEPLRLRADALRAQMQSERPGRIEGALESDVSRDPQARDESALADQAGDPDVSAAPVLEGIDFSSLAALAGAVAPAPAAPQDTVALPEGTVPWPEEAEAEALDPRAEASSPVLRVEDPDRVKVIGDLHIDLPLYNVYLNEADEWSRRLQAELGEWALELPRPLPESTVALAHALAGSSATVGFQALSALARTLEQALEHTRLYPIWQVQQAEVLLTAADSLRYLLHQFAAGFLKQPPQALMADLREVLNRTAAPTLRLVTPEPELQDPAPETLSPESLPDRNPEDVSQTAKETEDTDLHAVGGEEALPASEAEVIDPAPALASGTLAPAVPPSPQAQALAFEAALEIDVADAIDPELFPVFEQEAAELLPQLGAALRAWAQGQDTGSARSSVLRVLHTLKGSARLAGAMRLGEMAHRLESQVEPLAAQGLPADQADALLTRLDAMQQTWEALQAQQQTLMAAPATAPNLPAPASVALATPLEASSVPRPSPLRAEPGQTVRVRAPLLDRMLNQAGEVMATRSRLDTRMGQMRQSVQELGGNLERLRQHLRDLELQTESQMQSRQVQPQDTAHAEHPDFDPLEFDRYTQVQELTRMMAESVHDVATVQRSLMRAVDNALDDAAAQARQARELQRDLLRTRMVEFDSIAERLYGVVRQAAKDSGRQVRLDITGGTLELDRNVLDRMTPAFEHLLRNAVAHGIESAEQRQAQGKRPVGGITIDLHQHGNDVAITFQDDGAGLDLARITHQAQVRGLLAQDAIPSRQQAIALIFAPGFSTSSQVSALAGRGIGLDVVQAEVHALGGRIETDFTPGQGTRFQLVLPLTTAVNQVVLLRLGHLSVGVAAQSVEVVRRVPADELAQAIRTGTLEHDGESIPCLWGGALMQSSERSAEGGLKSVPVVICRSAGQRLALQVDEVLGNQEVVLKPLGPQLARLPGLAGLSVLPSGAVVSIYNPVALAAVHGEAARALQQSTLATRATGGDVPDGTPQAWPMGASDLPLVLVVDDSITVRRVTQRLLMREGYRVTLASDGLQALDRLREARPALVLTDIEMPRMDGFDLVRSLRADPRWQALPVIMITSRTASKHRALARELGVDHYLGKPYEPEELLGLVRHYVTQTHSPEAGSADATDPGSF